MFQPANDLSRCPQGACSHPGGRLGFWAARLALAVLVLIAAAIPVSGMPFDADSEAVTALLEELGSRYEILTLSDRYVLQPTDPEASFRSIEIKAGSVAVDGEPVSRDQLRELVGDTAETVLAISELGSEEGSAAEERRRRIEQLAEQQRLKAEEIEEMVRSRVEELESLKEEQLEAIEEALDEKLDEKLDDEPKRRRRRGSVRTDTRISFGSSLTIEDEETSQEVVVLGGSLDVEGKVRGDAVVIGGSVEVRGEVTGSVTAVGGSVSLGPGARIEGDAISIGGAVHRDPTAEIYGEITEVSLAPGFEIEDLWDDVWVPQWHVGWFDFGFDELFVRVGKTVVLAVMVLLLTLLFPGLIGAVGDRVRREPWKAGIVGLGTQLLFLFALPVVCMILLITIVGIPLALILAPLATLALVVLSLLGFAGVALAGGHLMRARFDWRDASPYLLVLVGLGLIQGWSILGEVLGFLSGPIQFLAWLVLLLGFLIKYVAWTIGLGAILMHYFSPLPAESRVAGSLPGGGVAPGAVPPPPAPSEPMDWDSTKVDQESDVVDGIDEDDAVDEDDAIDEGDAVDEDDAYLQAGAGDAEVEASEPGELEDSETTAESSEASEDDSDARDQGSK